MAGLRPPHIPGLPPCLLPGKWVEAGGCLQRPDLGGWASARWVQRAVAPPPPPLCCLPFLRPVPQSPRGLLLETASAVLTSARALTALHVSPSAPGLPAPQAAGTLSCQSASLAGDGLGPLSPGAPGSSCSGEAPGRLAGTLGLLWGQEGAERTSLPGRERPWVAAVYPRVCALALVTGGLAELSVAICPVCRTRSCSQVAQHPVCWKEPCPQWSVCWWWSEKSHSRRQPRVGDGMGRLSCCFPALVVPWAGALVPARPPEGPGRWTRSLCMRLFVGPGACGHRLGAVMVGRRRGGDLRHAGALA